ncbi:hypothetical protein CesoFtcFv8_005859 [Champsocephalus esox]|uniref:Uncharacterized protein n=2 Tax=Champsocephalus TaxID=52236 RepID=A0AAN8HUA9_CHAGU|nr:hypothetical protein CesoFtcFv8_005859 [Champsocephalus esox]KAK5928939.1 hypothetical protein CgunFtcFv8_010217 [Champsocephalus gunnari]
MPQVSAQWSVSRYTCPPLRGRCPRPAGGAGQRSGQIGEAVGRRDEQKTWLKAKEKITGNRKSTERRTEGTSKVDGDFPTSVRMEEGR